MSRVCDICRKQKMSGSKVSHSNRKHNRSFDINLQNVTVEDNGQKRKIKACTKCIKSIKA
ncbi:MAG: 50S ribosomal protein L28 [Clostridia bacterium]|jgi:large subunit ribosomal protein L28|nr:50S ribosomal protein L28 [Clostridia bacterium]